MREQLYSQKCLNDGNMTASHDSIYLYQSPIFSYLTNTLILSACKAGNENVKMKKMCLSVLLLFVFCCFLVCVVAVSAKALVVAKEFPAFVSCLLGALPSCPSRLPAFHVSFVCMLLVVGLCVCGVFYSVKKMQQPIYVRHVNSPAQKNDGKTRSSVT